MQTSVRAGIRPGQGLSGIAPKPRNAPAPREPGGGRSAMIKDKAPKPRDTIVSRRRRHVFAYR